MKLYNTLTRKKATVKTLRQDTVKLYTCGLTVYSHPHIGNWVSYVYWDVLQRTLEANFSDVQRVQNITDVGHLVSDDDDGEDKMQKGARAEGITAWEVADKYIKIADYEGYDLLGLQKPILIRATDKIDEQIVFVQELEKRGYTYVIEGEGVYFDTSKLDSYADLAQLDIEGLREGARVEITGKKNVTDFAVWKFSPKNARRDMEWDSPWGRGFPGWHLECSVIAREALGDQIDIHTGGIDHIPVHHTNEIAQTEAVTGNVFSLYWLHNNHLKVDGGKMSKSIGNVYTLQDIVDRGLSLQAFKLMIMEKHYRTEGNFTWDIMQAAHNRYAHWQAVVDRITQIDQQVDGDEAVRHIAAALDDDLNTPEAIMHIDNYFSSVEKADAAPSATVIDVIEQRLGITFIRKGSDPVIKQLLTERAKARDHKDWARSDELRDELVKLGYAVKDAAGGQLWSRTKLK